MSLIPHDLQKYLRDFAASDETLVVLTGAGISAESGIPTFRGKDGYWTVGSAVYQPEEMATHAMFSRDPEAVWSWYLYRFGVCADAEPNFGHHAVVSWEQALRERFLLITQNVDGLHLRAGNSRDRTYQIHGNVGWVRCASECRTEMWPLDPDLCSADPSPALSEAAIAKLRCPDCNGWARPHILWFDECYDEARFRFESSLRAACEAGLLIVVGTSGATNLPMQVGMAALQRGAAVIDVNPESNPFSQIADRAERGWAIQSSSGTALPAISEYLIAD